MTVTLKPYQTITVDGVETIYGTTGDTIQADGGSTVALNGSHMTFIAETPSVLESAIGNYNTIISAKGGLSAYMEGGQYDTVIINGNNNQIYDAGFKCIIDVMKGASVSLWQLSFKSLIFGNGAAFNIAGVNQTTLNNDIKHATDLYGVERITVGTGTIILSNSELATSTFHALN